MRILSVRHTVGSYGIMLYIDYTYAKRTTCSWTTCVGAQVLGMHLPQFATRISLSLPVTVAATIRTTAHLRIHLSPS
jgi:hypothetical protein